MFTNLLIGMPGGSEWILIILAVLILFGGRKIPELMRGLGKGIREFNDARSSVDTELKEGMTESERKRVESKIENSNNLLLVKLIPNW